MKKTKLFTVFLIFVFTFCLSIVALAKADESLAQSYLQQAMQNSSKAENLSFDLELIGTTPLADINMNLNGKYAKPTLFSGNFAMLVNVWILDTKFNVDTKIYSEQLTDNNLMQYMKISSTPPISKLDPNKWYVQSTKLTPDILNTLKAETSIEDNLKNIRSINLYEDSKDKIKMRVTYNQPFLDEEKITQLLNYTKANESNDDEAEATKKFYQSMEKLLKDSPKLQIALTKPRNLTYDITIDKQNMQIVQANADLTNYIRTLNKDILNSIDVEKYSSDKDDKKDVQTFINIAQNYIARSSLNMNVRLYNVNVTTVDKISEKDKQRAISFPEDKINEEKIIN